MAIAREAAQERCEFAHEKHDFQYNKGRLPNPFHEGDLILRETHVLNDADRGVFHSLVPKFEGPFRLAEKIMENTYVLEDMHSLVAGTRNCDQLKVFTPPPPWAQTSSSACDLQLQDGSEVEHTLLDVTNAETSLDVEKCMEPAQKLIDGDNIEISVLEDKLDEATPDAEQQYIVQLPDSDGESFGEYIQPPPKNANKYGLRKRGNIKPPSRFVL
jgi:hypothetical protein